MSSHKSKRKGKSAFGLEAVKALLAMLLKLGITQPLSEFVEDADCYLIAMVFKLEKEKKPQWFIRLKVIKFGLELPIAGFEIWRDNSAFKIWQWLSAREANSVKEPNKPYPFSFLYSFFPDDQRHDLSKNFERLKKAKKPQWFIYLKAIECWLNLFKGAIQIWWDNLRLPKNQNINK